MSGVLLALCFPKWEIDELVWIWQAPLLSALWFSAPRGKRPRRWKHGLLLGYLSGLAFFLVSCFWMIEVAHVAGTIWAGLGALVAFSAYLAIYFALFGLFASTTGRWVPEKPEKKKIDLFSASFGVLKVAILNGAAWCGLEWLRGLVFTGFGWNGLGVALKDHLVLAQFADTIGISGYGFVLMFCGIVAYCTLVRFGLEVRESKRLRPHFDFAVGVAMIIALFLYGASKFRERPDETIDVHARVMQLNIPLEQKWSEDIKDRQKVIFDYRDLTRAFVETSDLDLVLWPETALPGLFHFPWVQEYLNDHVLKGDDFYLLTGLEESNLEATEIYNTITLMKGDTSSYQMHRKVHLVPIGEYLPWRNTFPIFRWLLGHVILEDFTPGTSYEPLVMEKEGHEIGIVPLICFEDTVPRHARRFIRDEPQILVNVTNDGWFYESAEPLQHFHNAIFRCIEFRRPMIRAANTGISGFIDERGSYLDPRSKDRFPLIVQDEETGSTYIRGSIPAIVSVDRDPPLTFYAKHGDAFSVGMGILALLAAGISLIQRRLRRDA